MTERGGVGIKAITAYVPPQRVDAVAEAQRHGLSEDFVANKTGFVSLARRGQAEDTSDLAVKSFEQLDARFPEDTRNLDLLIVITQNPDGTGLPHVSARLHGRLALPARVAAFDISLGCSGWVYGLAVAKAFMDAHDCRAGVVVTADPYSKILDAGDRDTSLLFGDAATATLLTRQGYVWSIGDFVFGTEGTQADNLAVRSDGFLHMNGRAIFTFSATKVPVCIGETLKRNGRKLEDIDRVILHQGSRYIVETIGTRIGAPEKTPFLARSVGNTVSSSIPLILAEGHCDDTARVLVAGFGVGLSWAATVLDRGSSC